MKLFETETITTLNLIPFGTYFKLVTKKGVGNKVYIRDEYDRGLKKYLVTNFDNFCDSRLLKGDTKVFVGFTF